MAHTFTTADALPGCEGGLHSSLFSFPISSSTTLRADHQSFISFPESGHKTTPRGFQGAIHIARITRWILSVIKKAMPDQLSIVVWRSFATLEQLIRWHYNLCSQDNLCPVWTVGSQDVSACATGAMFMEKHRKSRTALSPYQSMVTYRWTSDIAEDVRRVPYRAPSTETAYARCWQKTRCKGSQDCILSCEVGSSCCDTVWHVVAKFCREQLISCENGTYHVAYNYCKIQ
jgi:hypothetical protein